jgi:hypothetical protein
LADFNRTEAREMIGHELAIEKFETANPHPRDQPRQRDFRCVGRSGKHALTKKSPAHRHSIQPADQFIAQPTFDAVGVSHPMKIAKRIFDIGIDPSVAPVVARFCAGGDDLSKGAICSHDKPILPNGFCQRFRQSESIQRQNCPLLGLDPECIGIVACVGHRENAIGVGAHEQIQIDSHSICLSRIARSVAMAYSPQNRPGSDLRRRGSLFATNDRDRS